MSEDRQQIYVFDDFRLETADRRFLKDDKCITVSPKAFDLLLELVKSGGHLIKKDELYSRVWAGQFVEDSNLTVQMSAIRKALGESKDRPHYISTVKGYGYRFNADVRELNGDRDDVVIEKETFARFTIEQEKIKSRESRAFTSIPGRVNRKFAAAFLGSAAILAALAGFAGYVWLEPLPSKSLPSATQLFQPASVKRLTTSGNAAVASLSPDGKLFVYSLNEKGRYSLWLGQTDGGGAPVLLRPPSEVFYSSLTFAPDGNSFYYVESEVREWQGVLYRSPVFGGVPEKVRENIPNSIAFAQDGTRFAFVRNDEVRGKSSIIIGDLTNSGADRELISLSFNRAFTVSSLSWSPDGSKIAASAVGDDETGYQIFTVTVSDGSIEQLTTSNWEIARATKWLNDIGDLIVVAQAKGAYDGAKLWQVSAASGEARPLNPDLHSYGVTLSLSADNREMLVMQAQSMPNIWVAPADDLRSARQITYGSKRDGWINLDWMPDGRLIYGVMSDNSMTVWTMDADGSNQKQLTSWGYIDAHSSMTANGDVIVFQSNRSGNAEIWRMNNDGSNMRQLTEGGNNVTPTLAPDGKWIVYQGDKSLWRIPLSGGDAVRLTEKTASWPRISPDSRFIACEYETDGKLKLAVFPIEGGEPIKLFDVPRSANFRYGIRWAPDGDSIAYRDWFDGIWKQPLKGGQPTRLAGLPEEKLFSYGWSRDGRHFAFVRGAEVRDFVLLRR